MTFHEAMLRAIKQESKGIYLFEDYYIKTPNQLEQENEYDEFDYYEDSNDLTETLPFDEWFDFLGLGVDLNFYRIEDDEETILTITYANLLDTGWRVLVK